MIPLKGQRKIKYKYCNKCGMALKYYYTSGSYDVEIGLKLFILYGECSKKDNLLDKFFNSWLFQHDHTKKQFISVHNENELIEGIPTKNF